MQTAQAFGQVHNSLSFFRESYADFASFRATLIRLTGLADANRRARALPVLDAFSAGSHLVVRGLDVRTPVGEALISELDMSLGPGDALLVKGPSGSGKTTLLRSIAQLWPYTNGSVTTPVGDVLFLSQRPYLPLGSLRAGLAYPDQLPSGQPNTGRSDFDDRRLHDALAEVHLAHLIGRLDEPADWTRILSPGEQQRLAFARVLLIRTREPHFSTRRHPESTKASSTRSTTSFAVNCPTASLSASGIAALSTFFTIDNSNCAVRDTGLSLITKAEKTFDGRILATGFGRVTRRAAIDRRHRPSRGRRVAEVVCALEHPGRNPGARAVPQFVQYVIDGGRRQCAEK